MSFRRISLSVSRQRFSSGRGWKFFDRDHGNFRGFTLVEVLLGIMLFSLIALSLYTVFSNGIRINQAAGRAERVYGDLRWGLELLAQDLENMVPYTDPKTGQPLLQAQPESLAFVIATDEGLKVVRYSLQLPSQTKVYKTIVGQSHSENSPIVVSATQTLNVNYLVRDEIPLPEFFQQAGPENSTGSSAATEEVLSTQVQPESLKFSFAFRDTNSAVTRVAWKDAWGLTYLPAGVRVEMSLLNPDNAQPAIMIHKDVYIPTGKLGGE